MFQCHQLRHQVKDCPELKGDNESSLASFQHLTHLPKEYNPNGFNDAYSYHPEHMGCEHDN